MIDLCVEHEDSDFDQESNFDWSDFSDDIDEGWHHLHIKSQINYIRIKENDK
jgi:hypothetical protein